MQVQRKLKECRCSESLKVDTSTFGLPIAESCWFLPLGSTIFGLAGRGEAFKDFMDRPHIARVTLKGRCRCG